VEKRKEDESKGEEKVGEEKVGEEVASKCTSVYQEKLGGLSRAKIVLLDIFLEKQPQHSQRVYAIVDDQSNASMISPELANKLGARGPQERYLLSTCFAEKEIKHGRRVMGLSAKSIQGEQARLPTLIECEHLPRDKIHSEITIRVRRNVQRQTDLLRLTTNHLLARVP
jgi:hypothetical protein